MELLKRTPERPPFALRDDPMLSMELDRLKPKSEPRHYRAPDHAANRRLAEIGRIVER
jgi:hypothetical protein